MNKLEDNISDIASNYYKYLMNLDNVTGVGLGFKRINNIATLEPCIHVLVQKKINSKYITSNNIVPKTYMGIKTDVIQSGKLTSLSNKSQTTDIVKYPYKFRPLFGGSRLSVNTNLGTLGCIVYKRKFLSKQYFILSTNTILANINSNALGFPVLQSAIGDIISSYDIVANLSTFVPLKTPLVGNLNRDNYVDCALAKINNKTYLDNHILGIGPIKGSAFAKLGESVKKSGYVTGVTTGEVLTKSATIETTVKNHKLVFKSQLLSDFDSKGGDSGSIVLNSNNEAVGLLYLTAGEADNPDDKNLSVFCDINVIQWLLDIEIYLGK